MYPSFQHERTITHLKTSYKPPLATILTEWTGATSFTFATYRGAQWDKLLAIKQPKILVIWCKK